MVAATKPYSTVRREIHNGDMLLFRRGSGLFPKLISIVGRSWVYHAGMAVRLDRRDCKRFYKMFPGLTPGLYCAHTVVAGGGRLDRLSTLVEWHSGVIKVRRPLPELLSKYDRLKAKREVLKIIGKLYGKVAIWRLSWLHLPIIRVIMFRYLLPRVVNDKGNGRLPFCSMAVSRACRASNLDPVPNLGDRWTEPGDLDRSAVFQDFCKLIP